MASLSVTVGLSATLSGLIGDDECIIGDGECIIGDS